MIGVRIVDFRSVRRNSLLGFARVELPSGMVIADVTVMLAGTTGRPWASPPSKPMVDREGVVLKDPNGKIRYTPIIEFTSREIRTRWSDAVIAAMQAAHPEAFVPRAAASVAIRLACPSRKADRWQVYDALPPPLRAVLQEGPNEVSSLWARSWLRFEKKRLGHTEADAIERVIFWVGDAHRRAIAKAEPWQPPGHGRRKPLPSPHILAQATMQTSGREVAP